ncbi:hypothetical protein [Microbispora sp. NPDC046933]|uniref:hypothetical protein n=1 Tax=Microbispora sp. NPDC046933 TaxID=3155618 RepID=UPI0033D9AF2F
MIGVHGINQHRREASEVAATWRGVLQRGLAESGAVASPFSFELVYYADLLEERRDDWKCGDDFREIDPENEPGPAALLAEWQAALAGQGAPDGIKGDVSIPATPLWTQRAVQRLAASPGLQGLGEAGIRRLARHMHAYLAHDEARRLILERLDAVAGSDPVTVLIGHSMGSVVAYEWLHTPASASVGAGCLFLTLGSPLGSYPIIRRLRPAPAFPRACEQWVNVASRHDPIAWPKRLQDVFGPPLADEAAPFRAWAHSARSYLRAPATVRVLSERLRRPDAPCHG